jgi:hypothetical protein
MSDNSLEGKIRKLSSTALNSAIRGYEKLHSTHPILTNYFSSAIGMVGGDALAKQFTENPHVKLRDIAFTATAAVAYSYLAPKMIELSTKATDMLGGYWSRLKDSRAVHTMFNTTLLTALYFPVNMAYWNYLTVKNQAPITWADNEAGAITLGIATIPYLIADYVAIKYFSQPETTKFLRPFYSAVEILWNTVFAGGNYLAKKI